MSKAPRLVQIDGLRAVAALLVVGFHYTTRFDQIFVHSSALPVAVPYGYFGVNLFFVISGFVIFMTLDKVRAPMEFVGSRFSRLFPTYWVAILMTWGLLHINASGLPGFQLPAWEALANTTMVHHYFGLRSVDGVYWSLAVELVFYLWMLMLWCAGFLQRPIVVLCVAPMLSLVASLAAMLTGGRVPYGLDVLFILEWAPWFCVGMLLYVYTSGRSASVPQFILVTALCLAAIFARQSALHVLVAILSASAVGLAARGYLAWLALRPAVLVGAMSYPLYLVHEKLGWITILAAENRGLTPLAAIFCATVLVLVVAYGLHRLVEVPGMMAFRNRFRAKGDEGSTTVRPHGVKVWVAAISLVLVVIAGGGRFAAAVMPKPPRVLEPVANVNFSAVSDVSCASLHGQQTFTILVLGQSNAGSHTDRAEEDASPIIVARDGHCLRSGDPLPGTTGAGSSIWTALDPLLRERYPSTEFVFAPLAIAATTIRDWTQDGPVRDQLYAHLSGVRQTGLAVDIVLWQQGEADMLNGTEGRNYLAGLKELRRILDEHGIEAPLIAARSTRCMQLGAGTIGRLWTREEALFARERIFSGPDLDSLGDTYRTGCHFNASGRKRAALLWFDAVAPRVPSAGSLHGRIGVGTLEVDPESWTGG